MGFCDCVTPAGTAGRTTGFRTHNWVEAAAKQMEVKSSASASRRMREDNGKPSLDLAEIRVT